jgi:hypothetical protein
MYSFVAWRYETQEQFHLFRNKVKHRLFIVSRFLSVTFRNVLVAQIVGSDVTIYHLPRCAYPSAANSNEQLKDSVGVPQVLMCRPQDVLGPES